MAGPSGLGDPTVVTALIAEHIIGSGFVKDATVTHEYLTAAIGEVTPETQSLGPALLQVELIDPFAKIARSGILTRDSEGFLPRIDVNWPQGTPVWWRLAMCDVQSADTTAGQPNLTLTFRHRIVAYLTDCWGPLGWPHGQAGQTRAQFLKMLVDKMPAELPKVSVGVGPAPEISFICPQINEIEPVASSNIFGSQAVTDAQASAQAAGINKLPALTAASKVTVKGSKPSAKQIQIINTLLGVGQALQAPTVALEAIIYAGTYETGLGADNYTVRNSDGLWGVLQSSPSDWPDPNDVTGMATSFFKGGKGFQGGGAISLATGGVTNPIEIAVRVEVPSIWPDNAYAKEGGYPGDAAAAAEATAIVNAFTGGDLGNLAITSGKQTTRATSPQVAMFDTDGIPSQLPSDLKAFAAYKCDGGGGNNFDAMKKAFPDAYSLSITFDPSGVTNLADCLDIEPNTGGPPDLQPVASDAGPWVLKAIAAGIVRPCVYGNDTNIAAIKASLTAAGLTRDQYRLWYANWNGDATVPAGYDAHQWQSPSTGSPGNYDKNVCVAGFFTDAGQTGASAGVSIVADPTSDIAQLTRGTPDNTDEDSWTCMQRLAGEVNWSLFTSPTAGFQNGEQTWGNYIYFMDGPTCAAQKPSLYLELSDDGATWSATSPDGKTVAGDGVVTSFHGTSDNTAFERQFTRTVKGKPQAKTATKTAQTPTEVTFNMIAGALEFNAGDVFVIHNFDPFNGRWIVEDVTQNVLSDVFAQFTLGPPTFPYPEPQANSIAVLGTSVTAGETAVGKAVGAIAAGVSGGIFGVLSGYVNPLGKLTGLVPGRIDQGVDYAGGGPLLALGNGKVTFAADSGTGWPRSPTDPSGGAVVYRLTDGVFVGQSVYVAENIKVAVRVGDMVSAGQQIATLINGGDNLETGWASGVGSQPLASQLRQNGLDTGQSSDPGGVQSAAGINFNKLLTALGAPSGGAGSGPLSTGPGMPAAWPTFTQSTAQQVSSGLRSTLKPIGGVLSSLFER